MKRWALALAVFAFGCGSAPESGSENVHWLDYEEFKTNVQPILAEGCSNPSCHAREERAFSLYAPMARRMDESRTHMVEPLTEEELLHNFTVSCVLSSDSSVPDQTLLLRKPLADFANTHHGGGAVFEGKADDRYKKLADWIARGRD